ncbi:ABC transporter ATP-binding protein [Methanococcus voltae]|uniref:Iron complex transport system ATP-binding protein n=2 Tax=Methanococcus voltae TaxID=2188 RepID=A0A8J7RN68_METVO|nr:ABC transporter ATP-binding protein [Methanococcus voltae]MBP2171788.1 iron complex transport system ATP-binding protein [Methanococcus voltae]MBP2201274.1 iron complex transport system ATP-binding protein [Methanococcus voltae]MCS3922784.1 iron complex transport system ATP-binding protein [Methanococcus voltae PS]
MIVSVDGVEFKYKCSKILENIQFNVDEGQVVSILGVNGAGKSTLLKCINRIISPKKGTIMIENNSLDTLGRLDLAKKVGYVPQRSEGNYMTVFDTLLLGRKPHIKWEVSNKDIEITERVLKLLDLEKHALRNTNELSGGELQKVIIGRALVQEPKVILLDEPTNNLDLKNQLEVMKIIKDISRTQNITSIIVMHDLNLALQYSDKFLLLKDGNIYAEGGNETINSESIEKVYGVEAGIHDVNGVKMVIPIY